MASSASGRATHGATLREARDDDAEALIALLTAVFDEYPGCRMDVDGEMPYLRAPARHFFQDRGGALWVAEADGRVLGCCGWAPAATSEAAIELHKLYLARDQRGTGVADQLVDRVVAAARSRRAAFIELWSDTRFERAHRFYARRGFVRLPDTRELGDSSNTVEYHFRLDLEYLAETSMKTLDRQERMRLMKFVCSFVWADLEVKDAERAHVRGLIEKLGLDPEEAQQVEGWLKVPPRPDDVDPALIPREHRALFLEAARAAISADGEIAEDERENLALLEQLVR